MQGFFSRLYKFKESDRKNQKENFLTEIFAYVLRTDLKVRESFLKLIDCDSDISGFYCFTQYYDPVFGKPDIMITIGEDSRIIIECKVDSSQGSTQLNRYHELLLNAKEKNKYLIYLTKHLEETEILSNIQFRLIRWYEVFDLLEGSENLITNELSIYLTEEKMSKKILFSAFDLNTVNEFKETYSKIKEFLYLCKGLLLDKYAKATIQYNELNIEGYYGYSTKFASGVIWIGFYQYPHNSELQLGLEITLPTDDTITYSEIDKKLEILNWDKYIKDKSKTCWYNSKGISTFFDQDVFDTKKALKFIEDNILEINKWFV